MEAANAEKDAYMQAANAAADRENKGDGEGGDTWKAYMDQEMANILQLEQQKTNEKLKLQQQSFERALAETDTRVRLTHSREFPYRVVREVS